MKVLEEGEIKKYRNYKKHRIFILMFFVFLAAVFLLFFMSDMVLAVRPSGATVSPINSTTAPADSPQSIAAQAGNVTELSVSGFTTTQSWQGYYGNISGTIQLADAGDNVMYNWSAASPEGEIYASTNDSIQWNSLMCFNFTASGTYGDDSGNTGGTSLYGMNVSQLETSFNISSDDVDGVDETFTLNGSGSHDLFYTASLQFDEGECRSTRIYSNAGKGENDKFEEVILYDSNTTSVVFASLLEQDLSGFDNAKHDFEMLVLEDGHGSDTQTTMYYFYVELQ